MNCINVFFNWSFVFHVNYVLYNKKYLLNLINLHTGQQNELDILIDSYYIVTITMPLLPLKLKWCYLWIIYMYTQQNSLHYNVWYKIICSIYSCSYTISNIIKSIWMLNIVCIAVIAHLQGHTDVTDSLWSMVVESAFSGVVCF